MMEMKNKWKTLSSKIVYKNNWISVREDQVVHPDGKTSVYGVVDSKPSICIVGITDKNKIIFVELVRYTNQIKSLEIPAGGSDGEQIVDAAKRELKEETGYVCDSIEIVGKYYPMNGIFSETCFTLVARGLKRTDEDQRSEEGITKVMEYSIKEVTEKIKNNEISDGQTLASLMQALTYFGLIDYRDNL